MSQKPKHVITKGFPKEFRELADSAIDHVGTMLDNMKLSDLMEVAPYAAVAYLGYQFKMDPKDAAMCVLGLKLATINGTPPVSQVAGLSILATYGVLTAGSWLLDTWTDIRDKAEGGMTNFYDEKTGGLPVDENTRDRIRALNADVAKANMDILQAINTNDQSLMVAGLARKNKALDELESLGVDISIYGRREK